MVDGDLGERVGVLEDLIGAPAHDAGTLAEQAELHSARIVEMHKLISDNQKDMVDRYQDCLQQLLAIAERVEVRFSAIENDIALLKATAVGATSSARGGEGSKLKVPEPKQFGGSRNAKELENFLWDMEQYFKAARVAERDQVTITSMYLDGDAKLWWRTRLDDDASAGRPRVETWEMLKKELRDQFLPLNTAWVAREALKKLTHTGTVRDYVKEFSSLMLDVKNMSEDDKLFNFFSGLQPWAQAELRRQNVKDLPTAIATADSLVDYQINSSPTGLEKRENGDGRRERKRDKYKKTGESSKQRGLVPPQSQGNTNSGCFLCNGNHKIRDCPKRDRLAALVTEDVPSSSGDSGECTPRVNPIQLLNAITVECKVPLKGLMYVKASVNGRQVWALLDTGATNNFVSQARVDHLGLKVSRSPYQVKAVNSTAQNIQGTTTSVLKIGTWEQECRFMALPLDEFDLILGMEFFVQAKAVVMPHLGGLLIADEVCPNFIPVKSGQVMEKPLRESASHVKSGISMGETTKLAALVVVKPDQVVGVPDQEAAVLEKDGDWMPAELPRVLPPRRVIGPRFELEPRARPLTHAPYWMAFSELSEQLGELLVAGYIQPSNVLNGAPALFQRKQVGMLRLCAANKVTVEIKSPVPNVAEWFDGSSKAAFFMEFDVRSGYWQVRIVEGGEAKTVGVTEFDFGWVHRLRRLNQVVDALGRKKVKSSVASLTTVQSDFFDGVKDQVLADKRYKQLRQRVKDGLVRKLFSEGDLLHVRGSRLYVPADGGLTRELFGETLDPQICEKVTNKRFHKDLVQWNGGPFEVIRRVGSVAYRLKLPKRMKIHPTFHVSFLKLYFEDVDQDRQQVRRALPNVRKQFDRRVSKVLDHQTVGASRRNRRMDYLGRWKGSSKASATWERDETWWQFEELIQECVETLPTRTSASSGGGGFVRPS